ncbi:hypothetical protein ILUMI_21636 [Ignelater luminosus]|uniref:Uncharacterized protein n=1 Tax=Ignelater luminosus TaxID=2038154 RepID=A0A8K0CC39_IGNLU|nr:hypothetical protein ILUMI_21636 [Ignelater luminosus]
MDSRKFGNPVRLSPWTSNAPLGHYYAPKTNFSSRTNSFIADILKLNNQTARSSYVNRHQGILKDNKFFKKLNKSTLILSFPQFHPDQIEAALSLCDNDLSETISLLRLRAHVLKEKSLLMEKKNRATALVQNGHATLVRNRQTKSPQLVKYIPTKYNDVQIVEFTNTSVGSTFNSTHPPAATTTVSNKMQIVEVNAKTLQMLKNCDTAVLPSNTPFQNTEKVAHTVNITGKCVSTLDLERSPATASTSSGVHSEDLDKSKVYTFAEDDPALLRKENEKSSDKVGVVLKKTKSGFSVSLL